MGYENFGFYEHITEAAEQSGRPVRDILHELPSYGIEYVEADLDDILRDNSFIRKVQNAGIGMSSIYGFYDFASSPCRERTELHIEKALDSGCKK